jgi:hypothetical protein
VGICDTMRSIDDLGRVPAMTDDHWFLTYVVVWTVLSVGAGVVLGALIF